MRTVRVLTRALWIGLGALLTSASGSAASFVSGDFEMNYDLALGGGTRIGGGCYPSDFTNSCAISGTETPGISFPAGGLYSSTSSSVYVDSGLGSDTVGISSSSYLSMQLDGGSFDTYRSLNLHLRDSSPDQFHTTADGSVSFASSLRIDTTTTLLPGQHLELFVVLAITADVLDVEVIADYEVIDLDTGLTLASFSHADPGETTLQIDGLNGHELAIVFSGQFSTSQPAGFANGASSLTDRSFGYGIDARTNVSIVGAVPEPSTAALLGVGLAALCWRRRRTMRT